MPGAQGAIHELVLLLGQERVCELKGHMLSLNAFTGWEGVQGLEVKVQPLPRRPCSGESLSSGPSPQARSLSFLCNSLSSVSCGRCTLAPAACEVSRAPALWSSAFAWCRVRERTRPLTSGMSRLHPKLPFLGPHQWGSRPKPRGLWISLLLLSPTLKTVYMVPYLPIQPLHGSSSDFGGSLYNTVCPCNALARPFVLVCIGCSWNQWQLMFFVASTKEL